MAKELTYENCAAQRSTDRRMRVKYGDEWKIFTPDDIDIQLYTVDGSTKSCVHQLRLVVCPHYFPRVLAPSQVGFRRISGCHLASTS